MSPSRLLAAGGVLIALMLATPAAARPLTAADLVGLDRASDVHVSPDGKWALYDLRSTDRAKNRGVHATYAMETTTGQIVGLGAPGATGSARWDPLDTRTGVARRIYYLSDQSGSQQVWVREVCLPECRAVAPPQPMTRLPLDIDSFRVAPDGRLIVSMAVFADHDDPAETKARLDARAADKATGRLYNSLFVRHWDTWADGTKNHLFAIDAASGGARAIPLTKGFDGDVPSKPFGGDEDYAVSPDGKTVYFLRPRRRDDRAVVDQFRHLRRARRRLGRPPKPHRRQSGVGRRPRPLAGRHEAGLPRHEARRFRG